MATYLAIMESERMRLPPDEQDLRDFQRTLTDDHTVLLEGTTLCGELRGGIAQSNVYEFKIMNVADERVLDLRYFSSRRNVEFRPIEDLTVVTNYKAHLGVAEIFAQGLLGLQYDKSVFVHETYGVSDAIEMFEEMTQNSSKQPYHGASVKRHSDNSLNFRDGFIDNGPLLGRGRPSVIPHQATVSLEDSFGDYQLRVVEKPACTSRNPL